MATKVTRHQIQSLTPSQLTPQEAIFGQALMAVPNPADGGLTTTWAPSSVLPRTALHGQALIYNSYTGTWAPSSIRASGGGALPAGTGNDLNKVLTWNGFEWILATPQGITSLGINTDSSLTVNTNTSNPITSAGLFTIGLSSVGLSKINQGGATSGQVLTWGGSTMGWTASAATNYVGGVKAWVVFDGTGTGGTLPMYANRNVTSVVDSGQGDYTINFSENTFQTNNYAFSTGLNKNASGRYTSSVVLLSSSATNFRIHTGFQLDSNSFTLWDASVVSLVFFE